MKAKEKLATWTGIIALLICLLTGCSSSDSPKTPDDSITPDHIIQEQPEVSYDDVALLFEDICSAAKITVNPQSNRLHVRIITDMPSDITPENWSSILDRFTTALQKAHESAASRNASTISAQIEASDETILASGYNGSVKYDLFDETEPMEEDNPPTISKFEYDQITVGMSLSTVTEIVGGPGTLENEVGTAGSSIGVIRTYTWPGEGHEGAYASILFDDYEVYSKHQIWLE